MAGEIAASEARGNHVQFARFLSSHQGITVKQVAKFVLVMLVVVTGGSLSAGTAETQIAERLKKVGEVCLEGQDCASAASAGMEVAAASGFDVEATYGKSCATCHNMGIAGAPKLGDVEAWAPRIDKGMDVLYDHGINGLAPGMPAKGMCFTCSDDDIKALVDYMVSSVE